jgi:hypothetical protein
MIENQGRGKAEFKAIEMILNLKGNCHFDRREKSHSLLFTTSIKHYINCLTRMGFLDRSSLEMTKFVRTFE